MTNSSVQRLEAERAPETSGPRTSADVSVKPASSILERYGGLALLAAIFLFFALTVPDTFLTVDNLVGVLSTQAIAAIVALGLIVPLAAGVFDISIAGMMTVAIVLVTWLFQVTAGSMPVVAAILLTLLAAIVVGGVNGLLVVRLSVDPFVATIGTSTILLGVSQAIANGATITNDIPSSFTSIARSTVVGDVPVTVVYALALAGILWYVLEYTPLGRRIYATGADYDAARLAGVPVRRIIAGAFVVSAVCATAAGILYAARLGSGPPNVGASYLLPAFAVAFLGATMIRPGRFNVGGLLVATGILAVGINGLLLSGMTSWVVEVFQGGALLVAVVISQIRRRRGG